MSVRPNIWRFVVEHFSAIARRSSSIALDLSELHGESPNALNGSQKRYRFRSFARIYKVKWFCSTYAPRLGQALTKCCHAVVRRLMMQMMSGAGSSGPAAAASTIDGEHVGVQQCCYGGRAMLGMATGGQWLENTNSAAYPHARFLDSCVTKQGGGAKVARYYQDWRTIPVEGGE